MKKELSNQDVLEGMNERFNMLFRKLELQERQFNMLSTKIYNINSEIKEIQKEIIWA